MGVHGLWNLLSPVARPIAPDSLKDKRLAVDASIWLYQFQMAIRDKKTGEAIKGNHIQGTYRRILKLLHWGIKPVFVFDGDAPLLKKRTIEKRRRRKEGAGRDFAKTAQQLLSAQLRNHAAENALSRRRNADIASTATGVMDTGDEIGADAVYLEDLEAGRAPKATPTVASTPSPIKKARKDAMRDEYALPAINGSLDDRVQMSDPRIATEEEFRDFIEDLRPEDLDVNSDFFGNLPTEVKYEILGDLRIKTRQVNHRRVQQMRTSATAIDFSRAQIDNLMERNHYTQKLLAVTDELGTSAIAIPTRVAGTRNREYLLVKQDATKGGGWVLGVKNPEIMSNEPITIDTTTDESVGGHTDEDEFEEVGIDKNSPIKTHLPTPDAEARRLLAVEAVRARYVAPATRPVSDPYLDLPTQQPTTTPSHLFIDGNDDIELQEALFESMGTAQRPPSNPSVEPISVKIPPPPTARQDSGDDSDDSMEYVDVPPVASTSKSTTGPTNGMSAITVGDTDDSDAFDEVDVAPPVSENLTVPTADRPTAVPTSRPPPEPHASPERTLLDTLLSSDSESEPEQARSPARSPVKTMDVPPEDPTPDEADVTARDFADQEDFAIGPPRPQTRINFTQAPSSSPERPSQVDTTSKLLPPVDIPNRATLSNGNNPFPPVSPSRLNPASPQTLAPSPIIKSPRRILEPAHMITLSSPLGKSTQPLPPPPPSPTPRPKDTVIESPESPAFGEDELPSTSTRSASPHPTARESPRPPSAELVLSPTPEDRPNSLFRRSSSNVPKKDENESEEEEMLPWSRSPTPPPNRRKPKPSTGPPQDLIDAAIEEASKSDALRDEQEEYAEIARTMGNEDIVAMQDDARRDMARLLEQRNAEQRNADGITRQMANEIKEMLILFGIPFLDAPQEAEAECASLLTRSLVDGVVTDDSDVFLFGASRVYRNMFEGNKYLECYLLSDFERELNLDRDKLVRLAYLLGGDYDDGLPGVGPVLARELVDEFEGEDGLEKFKRWWKKVEEGKDTAKETNTAWKRKFKKGHKSLVIEGNWPKPEIARAYYHPVVHESDEPFSWGGLDLDGLTIFLARTMGWSAEYCMKDLKPLLDRLKAIKDGKDAQQKSLPDFFDPSAGHDSFRRKKPVKYASERLQNVIRNWKTQQATVEELDEDEEEDEEGKAEEEEEAVAPVSKKRKSPTAVRAPSVAKKKKATKAPPPRAAPKFKKSTTGSRKKRAQELRDARAEKNGGVYSSEEDLDADDAAPAPPKKKQTTRQTRKKASKATVVEDDEEEV